MFPWLWVGGAVAVLLAAGAGFYEGDATAANRYQIKIDKMQIEAADRVQKTRDALIAQADAAVASLEATHEKTRTVFRTITQQVDKIVDRPIYRNVCLDSDGLVLVNAALAGIAITPSAVAGTNPGMPQVITPQ